MTPYEIGKISAFLLKNRKIEDRQDKRGAQRDEKDMAALLREAPMESIRDLEEMMNGYGFDLVTLTSFDVAGIGSGSRVYLLVRRANGECPLLDLSRTAEMMDPATGRATVAKIWFTQIWLLHLDLLYSQRDRGPQERNLWVEAIFTKDMLVQAIREHVNDHVRRINPDELSQSDVYEALTAEKGADIERYTKRFLDLMCASGMLEEKGQGGYRQTLLSAVEMKENYDRILAPLMLGQSSGSSGGKLADVIQPLLTKQAHEEADGAAA
jgi:hypothetical protein